MKPGQPFFLNSRKKKLTMKVIPKLGAKIFLLVLGGEDLVSRPSHLVTQNSDGHLELQFGVVIENL